jgi:SAM-dependent methyltransferase
MNPLKSLLGLDLPPEGGRIVLRKREYVMRGSVLRRVATLDDVRQNMAEFYEAHWKMPGAYDSPASHKFQCDLFAEMFGDYDRMIKLRPGTRVLDVGCGSGASARAFFKESLSDICYVGVDMSDAIETLRDDFSARQLNVGLLQEEINDLPFDDGTFDIVFAAGVLHYTLDMHEAICNLSRVLKRDGLLIAWIYKEQKPIRKLTDDYLRSKISAMTPREAFDEVKPLTELGIALGKLNVAIDVPDIPLLGVTAGRYDLQRFFYYHIMKLFYQPDLPFQRHIVNNWNAYSPKHVQFLPEQAIRRYFDDFEPLHWNARGNGVAIIAAKGREG